MVTCARAYSEYMWREDSETWGKWLMNLWRKAGSLVNLEVSLYTESLTRSLCLSNWIMNPLKH